VNISLGPVGSPGTDPADTVFIGKLNKLLRVAQLINAGALVKTDSKVTALVSDVAASLTTYWDKL
jgi:hypothetical protein